MEIRVHGTVLISQPRTGSMRGPQQFVQVPGSQSLFLTFGSSSATGAHKRRTSVRIQYTDGAKPEFPLPRMRPACRTTATGRDNDITNTETARRFASDPSRITYTNSSGFRENNWISARQNDAHFKANCNCVSVGAGSL